MLYYAGIGSRETPEHVIHWMHIIGEQLAEKWVVRSGFADGADKAFCYGAETGNGEMEIYLPWAGFNGAPHNDGRFHCLKPSEEATYIARQMHPAWNSLSDAVKLLHTRNVYQVLGHDLKTPSHMVVCWTPQGKGGGGTGQALRIARACEIPIFDLALTSSHQALCDFVREVEA